MKWRMEVIELLPINRSNGKTIFSMSWQNIWLSFILTISISESKKLGGYLGNGKWEAEGLEERTGGGGGGWGRKWWKVGKVMKDTRARRGGKEERNGKGRSRRGGEQREGWGTFLNNISLIQPPYLLLSLASIRSGHNEISHSGAKIAGLLRGDNGTCCQRWLPCWGANSDENTTYLRIKKSLFLL